MRTNIDIDEALMQEAFRYAAARTKRELVDIALREYVANHRRKDLRALKGTGGIAEAYDYKTARK